MGPQVRLASQRARLSFWGAVAFGVSAGGFLWGLSFPMRWDPRTDARAAAWEVLSVSYQAAFLVLTLACLAWMFGVGVLQYYLWTRFSDEGARIVLAGGLSLLGMASIVSLVMVRGFAFSDYAQAYVLVPTTAHKHMHLAWFGGDAFFMSGLGSSGLLIGNLLFVPFFVSLWRRLTTWYVLGTTGLWLSVVVLSPSQSLSFTPWAFFVRCGSGIILAVACGGLAWHLWKDSRMVTRGIHA